MTEAEWRTTDDWRAMLAWLAERPVSTRKWMLYLCAGLRKIWDRWLYSDHSRNAVEVAERAADGLATEEEIRYAAYLAEIPTFGHDFMRESIFKFDSNRRFSSDIQRLIALGVLREEDFDLENNPAPRSRPRRSSGFVPDADDVEEIERLFSQQPLGDPAIVEQLMHAASVAEGCFNPTSEWVHRHLIQLRDWPGGWLLREVFGNPFAPVRLEPAWRTEAVVGLATGIYDDKAFERMPILADALEEAGCDNADILSHCREPGVHDRGCWVVDLLLGK